MKKILSLLMMAVVLGFTTIGCREKEPDTDTTEQGIGTFKLADIVDAAAVAYKTWEDGEEFPDKFTVGDKEFTIANYQYAICKALVNINAGEKGDIVVVNCKPAEHPDRDSYDKETIAVANGPANGDETEDLVNVATRMLDRMKDGNVPNQTNFTRNGSAIAFSTNRATIVISRVLAAYKADGKLPASVDAGYKGAGATLKAFAQQLVTYLDVWENTVGTVDADGSHCTSNNTAWKNVHFIPIEYSGGYKDGEMYDESKFPIHHITVDGREYTAAECWSVAAQGIMDLVTVEGSALLQPSRNPFVHTMGNGSSLSEAIPAPAEYATVTGFNAYPWYENTNDGSIINFSETLPCTVEFLAHELGWYLTRCTQFDTPAIGNFQQFGKGDSVINFGDYNGIISAMRTFLIMIRFYDYLLKNDITENVWDAVKDVHLNYDLYGVDMPDIELKSTKLEFDWPENTKEASFSAKKAWTASASESWITIDQTSGAAGDITLKITVAANSGDARTGKVIVKGGNVTDGLEIAINQAKYTEPSKATIKEFAQEYVKIINVWASNVGKIARLTNWELAKDSDEDVVENAHYVPNDFTIVVGGKTYNTADMLETALRSYLLLRGWDGNETEKNGFGNIPTATPVTMEATVPSTHDYTWGSPLIETSNGGYLVKLEGEKEIHCQVDPVILDNWAQRSVNFQHGKNITNFCTYPRADHNITNYSGCFSSGRALLTYAYFFKYMLDNNLNKADDIPANTVIHSELFGNEEGSQIEQPLTIKDFAKEYVKILDIWEKTTGTIDYVKKSDTETIDAASTTLVENAHYVPMATTITVGSKTYNTADMLETALRSFLLLRGFDGNETEKNGFGSIPAATPVSMSASIPETHNYYFGGLPYAEPSNGGYLCKVEGEKKTYRQVEMRILDNWAQRSVNFQHGQSITNMCTYPRADHNITDYSGCFSSMRALITYAFFFKYMLDNNLDKADGIASSQIIRSELFGVENAPEAAKVTIKDFAKEYVKLIDVWEKTTGTIDMLKGESYSGGEWNVENAHYIPESTTIKVGDKTYNTADVFELALRSYLLVRGYDGLDTEHYGAGKIGARDGGAAAMSATDIPETHGYSWGASPYNETTGNGGHFVMGTKDDNTPCQIKLDALDNWAMRSLNYSGGKPVTNLCGYSGGQLSGYYGCFCSKRALITYAFFFKYMLDNNLDKADAIAADTIFRTELFGDEGKASGTITTADALLAYLADPSADAELGADIDLGRAEFTPGILTGNFDGKGHTVTYNLVYAGTVKTSDDSSVVDWGLFKQVNGSVKDLKVAGSIKFSPTAGTGTYHIGGVAGLVGADAAIENCTSSVNILADTKCTHHIGGIAGFTSAGATVTGCTNTGKVEMIIPEKGGANASQLGGIIGHIEGKGVVKNCTNDGQVTYEGLGTPRLGGTCGYINNLVDVSFINCVNNAPIIWNEGNYTSTSWSYVGGITGYYGTPTAGGKVLYDGCINNGNIECNITETKTKSRVGGIACHAGTATSNIPDDGVMTWTLKNCVNNGNISSTSTTANNFLGGIVGYSEITAVVNVDGCQNNATMRTAGNGTVGGILGRNCSVKSSFTNVKVGKDTKLIVENGSGSFAGLIAGWQPLLTTAITGKVAGGSITQGSTITEITAENFANFLLGKDSQALGDGGSITGVSFGE